MATNIPPHHLGEIAQAVALLLDNPQVSVDDLLTVVQGPDFPSGGIVFGKNTALREVYATGHGRFVMRAVYGN